MNTYKRQVKFCYYRVINVEFDDNGNEHYDGKFNLVEWLMTMDENSEIKHNMELSDCVVNLEQYYKFPGEDLYAIRAFKLRDANVPSKIKDGEDAMPIPLDSDEYIGEDINFIYDRKHSICMLQQNRMSIGVSRLVEWINRVCPQENKKVVFSPIADVFNPNRIGKRKIRSIEFSFANIEHVDDNSSLGQIIGDFQKYKGLAGKVVLSVGRDRNAELSKGDVVDLITDIQQNPGIVNSAKLRLKSDGWHEDDKARIEIVDLFENVVYDYIEFEIEAKLPLDFNQAKAKMVSKYHERSCSIERLCKI